MNSSSIGLDDAGMKASSGAERTKRTPLVEPSESGTTVVTRSKGFGSAYDKRRHNNKVSMLLVCAAAVIIVSAFAVAALGNGNKNSIPGHVSIPQPPFIVYGYTTDSGANPIVCLVNVTDLRTGSFNTTMSDVTGFYSYDISALIGGYLLGDTIRVDANTTTLNGTNTGTVGVTPYTQIDVTLTTAAIPEFSLFVIPVVGMFAIFGIARVATRGTKDE